MTFDMSHETKPQGKRELVQPQYSTEALDVLGYAIGEAERLRDTFVGPEHLFLALIRYPETRDLFNAGGVPLQTAQSTIEDKLAVSREQLIYGRKEKQPLSDRRHRAITDSLVAASKLDGTKITVTQLLERTLQYPDVESILYSLGLDSEQVCRKISEGLQGRVESSWLLEEFARFLEDTNNFGDRKN